jgi:hypothetical protein
VPAEDRETVDATAAPALPEGSEPMQPRPVQWTWLATLQVPWGPHAAGRCFGPGKLRIEPDLIVSAVVL